MKTILCRVLLVLCLLIGVGAGFSCDAKRPGPRVAEPAVIMEVLDPSLEQFSDMWK
jgi:phenylacetate-coenzyme A ligase PaaK-like adenylate-forming protein